jgi:hypothetical protein
LESLTSTELFRLAEENTDNRPSMALLREKATEVFGRVGPEHPVLEFGTRSGGSALALLSAILDRDRIRPLITVDPYGGLPYHTDLKEIPWVYSNPLYRGMMTRLSTAVERSGLNWMHLMMRDSDYMEHVWPDVPLYLSTELIFRPTFSFVYLDAEHTEDAVRRQLEWLKGKVADGGVILIDDADLLNGRGTSIEEDFGGIPIEKEDSKRTKKWILIRRTASPSP